MVTPRPSWSLEGVNPPQDFSQGHGREAHLSSFFDGGVGRRRGHKNKQFIVCLVCTRFAQGFLSSYNGWFPTEKSVASPLQTRSIKFVAHGANRVHPVLHVKKTANSKENHFLWLVKLWNSLPKQKQPIGLDLRNRLWQRPVLFLNFLQVFLAF